MTTTVARAGFRINHLNAPFDNVKARHAVQLLVDQETVPASNRRYARSVSDLRRDVPLCDTPFETFAGSERVMTQDIEKAKALVEGSRLQR